MNQEELERLHLEIAISESLQESSSKQAFATPEELAFFSDLKLDSKSEMASKASGATSSKPSSSGNSPPSTTSRPAQALSKSNSTNSSKPNLLANAGSSLLNTISNAFNNLSPPGEYCPNCGKICDFGRFITALGSKYHEQCFVCVACNQPINGTFAPRGEPPLPYHTECAMKLFTPICCVCSNNVTEQYLKHPFFEEEVYCCTHVAQPFCFACNKKEPLAKERERFTNLNDGRKLCPDCVSTVIMDSQEVQAIYARIVDYMQSWHELTIPPGMREVPILAVDVQSLNEELHSTAGKGICCTEGTVRGLTMSRRGEVRQMSGGAVKFDRRTGSLTMEPTMVKVEEVRDVTAVLVLYGLPEELATSIIAHEAMHVWMKLTKGMPFQMQSKVEEGLCQVMAYMYLEHVGEQRATGKADGMADKEFQEWKDTELLRSYLCHQIQNDLSPVYGDGFREAIRCVNALGLHEVLAFVKNNGKLPVV